MIKPNDKRGYTIKEVAKITELSEKTIRRMIARDQLKHITVDTIYGPAYRIPEIPEGLVKDGVPEPPAEVELKRVAAELERLIDRVERLVERIREADPSGAINKLKATKESRLDLARKIITKDPEIKEPALQVEIRKVYGVGIQRKVALAMLKGS